MNTTDPKPPTTPDEPPRITSFGGALEALLRNPAQLMQSAREQPQILLPFIAVVTVCLAVFGVVLGSFSSEAQLWAAPLKTTGGLLVAATICFPSFYIFSCLANAPLQLKGLFAAYLCFLALLGLLLIAFAPVLWIFTQSSSSAAFVGALSIVIWLLSFAVASGLLRKASHQGRSWQIHLWLLIFLLVSLQMTTALRPILGTSETFLPQEKRFFMTHWAGSIGAELSEDWEESDPATEATPPAR